MPESFEPVPPDSADWGTDWNPDELLPPEDDYGPELLPSGPSAGAADRGPRGADRGPDRFEAELERALDLNAALIGINNRNLKTFVTDLGVTLKLAPKIPKGVHVVAESGLSAPADLKRLAQAHVTSVLVGESLMRQKDVAAATRLLLGNGFR